MSRTIVALYDQVDKVKEVIGDLITHGFPREKVSLIASDPEARSSRKRGKAGKRKGETRALLEGAASLLVGRGAYTIPGVGPVLAAGPLQVVLEEAGMGAAARDLVGALTSVGVEELDAGFFAGGMRRDGALVLVYTEDKRGDLAVDLLNRHAPLDIERQLVSRSVPRWRGFNESPEQFAFDQASSPHHLREASSTLDFGPGARVYLAGNPVSAYDRSQVDLGNYQNDAIDEYPANE
jgi:hypothetical protein